MSWELINTIKQMKQKKVLICALDGTLIDKRTEGEKPKGVWDMYLQIQTVSAIKRMQPDYVLIVTNQSEIEDGYELTSAFEAKLNYVVECVKSFTGIHNVAGRYCKHSNPNNIMRKPNAGMIRELINFFGIKNKYAIDDYLMVGNDVIAGDNTNQLTAENYGCEYMDIQQFINTF